MPAASRAEPRTAEVRPGDLASFQEARAELRRRVETDPSPELLISQLVRIEAELAAGDPRVREAAARILSDPSQPAVIRGLLAVAAGPYRDAELDSLLLKLAGASEAEVSLSALAGLASRNVPFGAESVEEFWRSLFSLRGLADTLFPKIFELPAAASGQLPYGAWKARLGKIQGGEALTAAFEAMRRSPDAVVREDMLSFVGGDEPPSLELTAAYRGLFVEVPDPGFRAKSLKLLRRASDPETGRFLESLATGDSDAAVRRAAVEMLAWSRWTERDAALERAYASRADAGHRREILRFAHLVEGPAGAGLLARLFAGEKEADLRAAAVAAAGAMDASGRRPAVTSLLSSAPNDPSPQVRRAAVKAVGHGRWSELRASVQALSSGDPSEEVVRAARAALEKLP